jgi:hypothetical protein
VDPYLDRRAADARFAVGVVPQRRGAADPHRGHGAHDEARPRLQAPTEQIGHSRHQAPQRLRLHDDEVEFAIVEARSRRDAGVVAVLA